MNRKSNIIFKVLGGILGLIAVVAVALIVIGPKDPVILTPQQQAEEKSSQIKQYANVDLSGFSTKIF